MQIEPTSYIRLAEKRDARIIASIHYREINKGFLAELGENFLEKFYESIIESGTSFCVVAEVDSQIVGFISGCTNINAFYRDFFKSHSMQAIKILFPKILNVRRVKKIIETLLYPRKEKTLSSAELLTIAVRSQFHGKGIAENTFRLFVNEMKNRGVEKFRVVVGESLPRAIRFYEKIGFVFHSNISIHSGEISRVYVYEITD